MVANNDSRPPINRPVAFWAGILLSAMGIGLTVLSAWILLLTHRDYAKALQADVPVLLEETGNTVFYLAPIAYLGLVLFGLCAIVVAIRGKAFTKAVSARLNKIVGLLAIIGVAGTFFGSYVANKLWAEHFQNHGYVECSQSFSITSKWFVAVWVDSTPLCDDTRILELFAKGKKISYINHFIEERRP